MYDILLKKRARNMIVVCIAALLVAVLMIGCIPRQNGTDSPVPETKAPAATNETKATAASNETKAPAKPGKRNSQQRAMSRKRFPGSLRR